MWSARRRVPARYTNPGSTGTVARQRRFRRWQRRNPAACRRLAESGGCFGRLVHAQLPGDGERVDGATDADDGAQGFVDLTARAEGRRGRAATS